MHFLKKRLLLYILPVASFETEPVHYGYFFHALKYSIVKYLVVCIYCSLFSQSHMFDLCKIIVGNCFDCCVLFCVSLKVTRVGIFIICLQVWKLNPELLNNLSRFLASYDDEEIEIAFSYLSDTVLYSFHTWSHLVLMRTLSDLSPIPFYRRNGGSVRLVICSESYIQQVVQLFVFLSVNIQPIFCLVLNLCCFLRK